MFAERPEVVAQAFVDHHLLAHPECDLAQTVDEVDGSVVAVVEVAVGGGPGPWTRPDLN